MSKTPILGTGLNGLVGSRFVKDFSDKYQFDNLDLRDPQRPVDITNYQQVLEILEKSAAKYLIHFAAFTNVTAAWEQTDDLNGLCYQVNVVGTENIVKACQATGKHLIHISTAYVFDGEKDGLYNEEDQVNPIEWYGKTKILAEKAIQASENLDWTILRIDQPFRSDRFEKVDTLHRVIDGIKSGSLYPQFADHYFGPTFVDDFAKILDFFIRTGHTGLFHASSGEKWSDYDFAKLVNEALELGFDVKKGSLTEYLKTSNRPYQRNTAMDTSKLEKVLDFEQKNIKEIIHNISD
jgi:dTDP-4-dehydrorhamnose reductase